MCLILNIIHKELYSFYTIYAQISIVTVVRQPFYKQISVVCVDRVRKFGMLDLEDNTNGIVFFCTIYTPILVVTIV